jgi:hypothetical protein
MRKPTGGNGDEFLFGDSSADGTATDAGDDKQAR